MHLHLLQRVRVIFLRTPITIYNYVFQENSQYSSCCEQRLQAISNKWSNPPVFWGIFALARSADSWCKGHWLVQGVGLASTVPRELRTLPGHGQDWNADQWYGHHSPASSIHLAFAVCNTRWQYNAQDFVFYLHYPTGSGKETLYQNLKGWACSFLAPFLTRMDRHRQPGELLCASYPWLVNFSLSHINKNKKKKQNPNHYSSTPSQHEASKQCSNHFNCLPPITFRAWVLASLAFDYSYQKPLPTLSLLFLIPLQY